MIWAARQVIYLYILICILFKHRIETVSLCRFHYAYMLLAIVEQVPVMTFIVIILAQLVKQSRLNIDQNRHLFMD